MESKIIRRITWILLIILILLGIANILVNIHNSQTQDSIIQSKVKKQISNITLPKDGYSPVKNKDYFDGKDGIDGTNTVVHDYTNTSITIAGKDGLNGSNGKSAYEIAIDNGFIGTEKDWLISLIPQVTYPDLRCNILKNRWEIKYPDNDTWQVLNGEIVPCLGVQ